MLPLHKAYQVALLFLDAGTILANTKMMGN